STTNDMTGGLQKIKWSWTCDSAGAYSEASTVRPNGMIYRLVTIPTDGPTDAYNVTILDADGVDVLNSQGLNRATATTEQKGPSDGLGVVKSSLLTLTIANAGDAKSGTVILYVLDLDKGVLG
ncbi:MAG: hypothetical protein WC710_14300, partial [Gallionella sp.]